MKCVSKKRCSSPPPTVAAPLQRRGMPTCTVRDKRSLSAKTAPAGSLLSRLMAKGGSHARVLKAGPRDGAVGLGRDQVTSAASSTGEKSLPRREHHAPNSIPRSSRTFSRRQPPKTVCSGAAHASQPRPAGPRPPRAALAPPPTLGRRPLCTPAALRPRLLPLAQQLTLRAVAGLIPARHAGPVGPLRKRLR